MQSGERDAWTTVRLTIASHPPRTRITAAARRGGNAAKVRFIGNRRAPYASGIPRQNQRIQTQDDIRSLGLALRRSLGLVFGRSLGLAFGRSLGLAFQRSLGLAFRRNLGLPPYLNLGNASVAQPNDVLRHAIAPKRRMLRAV